jgi:hypothetical protein
MTETLHIGNEIRNELLRQGRSVAWLARELGYDRSNFYRVLNAPSIDTALLLRISQLLRNDFFQIYTKHYVAKGCQI